MQAELLDALVGKSRLEGQGDKHWESEVLAAVTAASVALGSYGQ